MFKNIIMTESQLQYIVKSVLNEAFGKKKTGENSLANNMLLLKDREDIFREHGMTLFKDESSYDEIVPLVRDYLNSPDNKVSKSAKKDVMEYYTDESNYVDQNAYEVACFTIAPKLGVRISEGNPYYDILHEIGTKKTIDGQHERDKKRYGNVALTKAAENTINKRNEAFDGILGVTDGPAYDFFANVIGQFPIHFDQHLGKEKMSEMLMPYAEEDPRFQQFVNVRQAYSSIDCKYDGNEVLIPVGHSRLQEKVRVLPNGSIQIPNDADGDMLRENLKKIIGIAKKNGLKVTPPLIAVSKDPLVLKLIANM